ncbi:MAG: hypothetical protein ACE5WD_14625 [Candidatus Aminicenantia bacterium]
MAISNLFKKQKNILFRCSYCYFEYTLSLTQVRLLERLNHSDPICQPKEPCHICHIGFMIPVNYTNKQGKQFLFHQIKPKIKNLDPDTVMERILEEADPENIQFFGLFDTDD